MSAVGCKAGFTNSPPDHQVYHLMVAPVEVDRYSTGRDVLRREQRRHDGNELLDGERPSFTLEYRHARRQIRYSTDGLSIPSCVGNAGTGVTEIDGDGSDGPGAVAPFTIIMAIGCHRTAYQDGDLHVLSYANPAAQVQLNSDPGSATTRTTP